MTRQVLPADFGDYLRDLYSPYRPTATLRLTLAAAHAKGWTLKALADAIGVTHQRVHQIVRDVWVNSSADVSHIPVPAPPVKPVSPPREPRYPTLTETQRNELAELCKRANGAGNMAPDHPVIVASRQLANLLSAYRSQGHTFGELAAAMHVRPQTVKFRLGRHGYLPLPPSQRSKPGPIAAALAVSA
jgi:hypothetical protein